MRAAARALAPARASAPARAVARRRPAPIRRRRAARAGATATRASADDRDALDAFARATPRATRAFELLRESRRAIDAEAMTAMCYVGAIRRRRATRGETACVAKICERWSARVGGRLGRVRASLEAEDGSAAARAVAREVGKCEAEATALAQLRDQKVAELQILGLHECGRSLNKRRRDKKDFSTSHKAFNLNALLSTVDALIDQHQLLQDKASEQEELQASYKLQVAS